MENLLKVMHENVERDGLTAREVSGKFDHLESKLVNRLDLLEQAQREDVAELQALKNKGAGLLIGVGIMGTALGAALGLGIDTILGALK